LRFPTYRGTACSSGRYCRHAEQHLRRFVTRNVAMGSAHCLSSDAWVGRRWHRQQGRATASDLRPRHAGAARCAAVCHENMRNAKQGRSERASRFFSLASIAIAREMLGAGPRALAANSEKMSSPSPMRGAAVGSNTMHERHTPFGIGAKCVEMGARTRITVESASSRKGGASAREFTGDSDHAGNSRLRVQRRDCATRTSRRCDKAIVPPQKSGRLVLILEWPSACLGR